MNCEEFRIAVSANPGSSSPELTAHAAQCPNCAQYWQELRDMDRLIHRALTVSVPAQQLPNLRRAPRRMSWSLAASVLVTVSIAVSIWLASARDTFAEQVITHVRHEQHSLVVTSETIEPAQLEQMLARFGLRLKPGATRVSYAMTCHFRGHEVPHMVVQSDRGPVTVLVLQQERTRAEHQLIDEEGFQGVIMSAPRGVLVVLGQNVPVDDVANTLLAALEYEPRPRDRTASN